MSGGIFIRHAEGADAEPILRAREAAIRAKAPAHYSPEQVKAWINESPLTSAAIGKQAEILGETGSFTFVAEYGGRVIGFASVIPAENKLLRMFVAPGEWRGAGSALLQRAEAEARKRGATHLNCEASLNAEGFYVRHGFEVTERSIYRMSSGVEAPSVKMTKYLGLKP